jgi:hypothetical protein
MRHRDCVSANVGQVRRTKCQTRSNRRDCPDQAERAGPWGNENNGAENYREHAAEDQHPFVVGSATLRLARRSAEGIVMAGLHIVPSTKSLSLLFEASELKAASEQVSASGQRDRLKVLSALVAAVRHPVAVSAL